MYLGLYVLGIIKKNNSKLVAWSKIVWYNTGNDFEGKSNNGILRESM